jgi:hypothetical protein
MCSLTVNLLPHADVSEGHPYLVRGVLVSRFYGEHAVEQFGVECQGHAVVFICGERGGPHCSVSVFIHEATVARRYKLCK